jgi:hypothetical protein
LSSEKPSELQGVGRGGKVGEGGENVSDCVHLEKTPVQAMGE